MPLDSCINISDALSSVFAAIDVLLFVFDSASFFFDDIDDEFDDFFSIVFDGVFEFVFDVVVVVLVDFAVVVANVDLKATAFSAFKGLVSSADVNYKR